MYLLEYDIVLPWETIEQKAALPSYFFGGHKNPPDEGKEGDTMYVTYADLFQLLILIVALASLIYQIFKDKRK